MDELPEEEFDWQCFRCGESCYSMDITEFDNDMQPLCPLCDEPLEPYEFFDD